MLDFFRAGGLGMIFVLLFGVLALVAAIRFVQRPTESASKAAALLTQATLLTIATGVFANLSTVLSRIPNHPEWSKSPELPLVLMVGLSEALTPGILGFSLLAVATLLRASGERRLGRTT